MAALVGMDYSTGKDVTVAVNSQGHIITAAAAAQAQAQTSSMNNLRQEVQNLRDEIAQLRVLIEAL